MKRFKDCDVNEFYKNVVNELGLENVRSCIPFTDQELLESYAISEFFNTTGTPIQEWDAAAGFYENRKTGQITIHGSKLISMLKNAGVKDFTPSQLVCILKEAARMHIKEDGK